MKPIAFAVLALSALAARRADDLAIQDLKVVQSDATTCVLEWTAPEDTSKGGNGIVEYYEVFFATDPNTSTDDFKQVNGFDNSVKTNGWGGIPAGGTVSYTITGLVPNAFYRFAVLAVGNDGYGPLSNTTDLHGVAPTPTPSPSPSPSPVYTGATLHESGGACGHSAAGGLSLALVVLAAAIGIVRLR